MNEKFLKFVADELVPKIDADYQTNSKATARAILGTSLGGINSAYFGISRPDVFGLIAIQSPAFNHKTEIYASYQNSPKQPLNIFMTTGVIHDTENAARHMKQILEEKDYSINYIEVNEGHSWGNWRALLDDMLIYFWGNFTSVRTGLNELIPRTPFLLGNYPNPFNPHTRIRFYLPYSDEVSLEIFNLIGQKMESCIYQEEFSAGYHQIKIEAQRWASGLYIYQLKTKGWSQTAKMLLLK